MLDKLRHIYFLGIGGIGMSALARYFHSRGIRISGYDKTPSEITDELSAAGMSVHFEDDVQNVPSDIDLVVITPAIPVDHKEWKFLREKGIPIKKRAEVLGMISRDSVCLAVAGTHGKTTTTTMLAHLLRSSGVNCTAFLGGIAANYMTNYLQGNPELVVVEADEYDRSFLHLTPAGAILTSIDADHLDIYEDHAQVKQSYKSFTDKIVKDGTLVLKTGLELDFTENFHSLVRVRNYGIDKSLNCAVNIRVQNGAFVFDYKGERATITDLTLSVPGRHNVENATAAITLALEFGATAEGVKKGIGDFRGVHRRFEFALRDDHHVVIDDYAHHPEELKAAISAARELYPAKKITGVFQPHLFSRTRDFADQFAHSLDLLDTIILLEIYPARELPIPGISSQMLLDKISRPSKFICAKENLVSLIEEQNPEVTLLMGAGDIDRLVKPVASALQKKGGRIMMKKILVISGWFLCGSAIIFLTGFAVHQHNERQAGGVDVAIEPATHHFFISEDDIKTSLIRSGFNLDQQTISSVDIPTIEQLVLARPDVESCEACITVEGKVYLKISERRPIARITNVMGESFYMDDKGKLMPWSAHYTAPVILVNGNFADSYEGMKERDFSSISADSSLKTATRLDDIWNIVKAIDADSFLRVQMVQLYLSPENGFELIPRVGDHKIVFGDAENIDGKFKKLNLFYMYGLNKTGRWSEYSAIDLRYKNQIVCTKKPIANGI